MALAIWVTANCRRVITDADVALLGNTAYAGGLINFFGLATLEPIGMLFAHPNEFNHVIISICLLVMRSYRFLRSAERSYELPPRAVWAPAVIGPPSGVEASNLATGSTLWI